MVRGNDNLLILRLSLERVGMVGAVGISCETDCTLVIVSSTDKCSSSGGCLL